MNQFCICHKGTEFKSTNQSKYSNCRTSTDLSDPTTDTTLKQVNSNFQHSISCFYSSTLLAFLAAIKQRYKVTELNISSHPQFICNIGF